MARLLSLRLSLCCRRLLSLQLLRILLLQALPRGGKGGILGLQQCMRTCLQCVRVQCGIFDPMGVLSSAARNGIIGGGSAAALYSP